MYRMFRTISDFLAAWSFESEATAKVFRALTDASLDHRLTPGTRSLGGLAWHLTGTLGEMMTHAGLPLSTLPNEHSPAPRTVAELVQTYEASAKAVADAVQANWTDGQLQDEIPMYGEKWKKTFVLSALIAHQTHHRGQMTVVMRHAGLRVPGIYGPAEEDWATMGMKAPAV
jgi:uncharacterized damage-inducible protein DinB